MTACGKPENATTSSDTEVTQSVAEETETEDSKETAAEEEKEVSTAGDIEVRYNLIYDDAQNEIVDAEATISYLPQQIETLRLTKPLASYMHTSDGRTYPSIEHINEMRTFAIELYNELVLPFNDTYREEYNNMCPIVESGEVPENVTVTNMFNDELEASFGDILVKGSVTEAHLSKGEVHSTNNTPKRMASIELVVTLTIDDKVSLNNYVNEILNEDQPKGYDYTKKDEESITALLTIPGVSTSAEASSDTSESEGTGVFGRWIPSYSEMYYCLELNMNCTGTLYRGAKTYPLTFVINGNKITVTVNFDGSPIKSQYFYEDDTLVSDQDNTIFTRE